MDLFNKLVTLAAVLLWLSVVPLHADTLTLFQASTTYPIAEVGLALCSTTQSCSQSLGSALDVIEFAPPPAGGEYTVSTSDPAAAGIAAYLRMTNQQIVQSALNEAIVPFFWNAGPNPMTANFFTASQPDVNYYEGHFDQAPCAAGECGYPLTGGEIDALSIAVSSSGQMAWSAEGIGLVPEPYGLELVALGMVGLILLRNRLARISYRSRHSGCPQSREQ